MNESLVRALLQDWRALPSPEITLPRRYQGGLLFGQLVPRFDNRIIATCPISGQNVPSRNCREFLDFRWGMQLANIRVAASQDADLRPLTRAERASLDAKIRERGYLTASELKRLVPVITSCPRSNLETMLMHPDAEEALLVDPLQKLVTSARFAPFWDSLPPRLHKRFSGQLLHGRSLSPASIRGALAEIGSPTEAFDAAAEKAFSTASSKGRKKDKAKTREEFMAETFGMPKLSGRAPYSREVMKHAYTDALAGKVHPKEEGGSLFITPEIKNAQLNRPLDTQTNNHLVRHRLMILERLFRDLVEEYAGGDRSRIKRVAVEVTRDLREMSGKTNEQIAQDVGRRLANFKDVVKKLEEDESFQRGLNERGLHRIPPGLIRKARIAEDLGWTCPYTGLKYEPVDLLTKRVDKDHIVPRSQRTSDALEALVMTCSAVNAMKKKRTALEFIEQEGGKPVDGLPQLSIRSFAAYEQFVQGLESFKGHEDDKRRKRRRKELLMVRDYEEQDFTPGDLTKTSQIARLGAQVIERQFPNEKSRPVMTHIPGSVTGILRKGWNRNLLGCLSTSAPEVLDEHNEVKTKTDIRDITHLHHAVDAVVLALADALLPRDGNVWELILKRRVSDAERLQLRTLGIFDFSPEGFGLTPLPREIEDQLRARLAEQRVVQHLPAGMGGLCVEQNTWRLVSTKDGKATIRQRVRGADGTRTEKERPEKVEKLLGSDPKGPSKLQALKGVLIIPDNYGLALDPEPAIIPFHKVWSRLQILKAANGGKMPQVLRNGQIIRVNESAGANQGFWRVFSTKNATAGFLLNIGRPDVVRLKNKEKRHRINVRLNSLLKHGFEIVENSYTGVPACPSTSSA